MFKGSRRGNYASTLNKPVVIHRIGKPVHATKDDILRFLEEFITSKESLINNTTSTGGDAAGAAASVTLNQGDAPTTGGISDVMLTIDTNLTSSLSQLKRIQRDFQGLPPQSSLLLNASSTSISSKEQEQEVETGDKDNNDDGKKEEKITKSATGGTKKTFADDE